MLIIHDDHLFFSNFVLHSYFLLLLFHFFIWWCRVFALILSLYWSYFALSSTSRFLHVDGRRSFVRLSWQIIDHDDDDLSNRIVLRSAWLNLISKARVSNRMYPLRRIRLLLDIVVVSPYVALRKRVWSSLDDDLLKSTSASALTIDIGYVVRGIMTFVEYVFHQKDIVIQGSVVTRTSQAHEYQRQSTLSQKRITTKFASQCAHAARSKKDVLSRTHDETSTKSQKYEWKFVIESTQLWIGEGVASKILVDDKFPYFYVLRVLMLTLS